MVKENLKKMRVAKGFNQKQMADIISTDVSNYCRKEKGEVKIIKSEWEKLAQFLEVPFEDIFEEDETKISINYENATIGENSANVSGGENSGNINNNNTTIPISIVEHLEDYIELLKKEIKDLKQQINLTHDKKNNP